MAPREDMSDALEQRWAEHWAMAMRLGIDEANETIYRAHFQRNSELADTDEGRAQILDRGLAMQEQWWRRATGPRAPEHPDFQLEERGESRARGALQLHREAETYARTHEMGYPTRTSRSPRVGCSRCGPVAPPRNWKYRQRP